MDDLFDIGGNRIDVQRLKDEILHQVLSELEAVKDFEPDLKHEWGVPEVPDGGSEFYEVPEPFDLLLEFDSGTGDTTATLRYLYSLGWDVQESQGGTLSDTLPNAGSAWIGVEQNLASGAYTMLVESSLSAVSESSAPTPGDTSRKRALYYLESSVDGSGNRRWRKVHGMRMQPVIAKWS